MKRITFTVGDDQHWAQLRDPGEVTVAGRRVVKRALVPAVTIIGRVLQGEGRENFTPDECDLMDTLAPALLEAMLVDWSFVNSDGVPIDTSQSGIESLDGDRWDALQAATSKESAELIGKLQVKFDMNPETLADPASPTVPSSASGRRGKATASKSIKRS